MNDDHTLSDDDALAALGGDHVALNRLATVATIRLMSLFLASGHSHHDAQDLIQSTLERTFGKLGANQFSVRNESPAAALMSWIFEIGRRMRLEFFKKSKLARYDIEEAGLSTENIRSFGKGTIDDAPSLLETCVNEALEFLPDGDSHLLRASHFWCMKDEEIAHHLGVSHAAVRKRLQRARDRFRKLLEKDVRLQHRLSTGAGVRCLRIKPPTDAAA